MYLANIISQIYCDKSRPQMQRPQMQIGSKERLLVSILIFISIIICNTLHLSWYLLKIRVYVTQALLITKNHSPLYFIANKPTYHWFKSDSAFFWLLFCPIFIILFLLFKKLFRHIGPVYYSISIPDTWTLDSYCVFPYITNQPNFFINLYNTSVYI